MRRLLDRLETVAVSDAPVLVTGESGTGKELVARRIHAASPRRAGPFVAVNCAAFPEGLVEAELFGHERGAFTGAIRKREGRFKLADGGTLLLDEVAELPLPAQAKLLRVLQEGVIEPLGSNALVRVDVRIVSATHRDLRRRIAEGLFREDLYYRLNVVGLHIPPARASRRPAHARHRTSSACTRRRARPIPEVSLPAWQALAAHPFLGNVRELGHAIQHAVVLSRGGPIELEHLPADVVRVQKPGVDGPAEPLRPLSAVVKAAEREHLLRGPRDHRRPASSARRSSSASRARISGRSLQAHGISDSDIEGLTRRPFNERPRASNASGPAFNARRRSFPGRAARIEREAASIEWGRRRVECARRPPRMDPLGKAVPGPRGRIQREALRMEWEAARHRMGVASALNAGRPVGRPRHLRGNARHPAPRSRRRGNPPRNGRRNARADALHCVRACSTSWSWTTTRWCGSPSWRRSPRPGTA